MPPTFRRAGGAGSAGPVITAALAGLAVLLVAGAGPLFSRDLTTERDSDLAVLFRTLKGSVGLYGDIALSLETQEAIASLGKGNPSVAVPVIVEEMESLDLGDRKHDDYRMALISVIEGMGPAAEGAVPALSRIVQKEEVNEWVRFKAQSALLAINTPRARAVDEAANEIVIDRWLQGATADEISRAVNQHAYFIRRELRRAEPSEEIIETSVRTLLQTGRAAEGAAPDLRRAWGDPRIGAQLRSRIEEALASAGVRDFDSAPAEERSLLTAIAVDVLSDDQLIGSMAMMELGELGPSAQSVDLLVAALKAGRNPGQAALILGGWGGAAAGAVPFLRPWLRDAAAGPNAIQALGRIGVTDAEAMAELRDIAAEEGNPNRGQAVAVLGKFRTPEALPELLSALSSSDKYTRILAARAVGALGESGADAVPSLMLLLDDPDADLRKAAAEALGMVGPPAAPAVPLIARQLQYPDRRLKEAALLALERIGGDEAVAALEEDGARYARSDRAEYHRLRQSGDIRGIANLLRELPRMRSLRLAREMLEDGEGAVASLGASFLVSEGFEEEAVPFLARTIAAGEGEPGFRRATAYGVLRHDGGEIAGRLRSRLQKYLRDNIDRFNPEERERIETWLRLQE